MSKLTEAVRADPATQQAVQVSQLAAAREDKVGAKTTIKLDEMQGVKLPSDWEIEMPMGDILMAAFVDENDFGEVYRDGVWLKQELTARLWRVAEIIKVGPGVSSYLPPGALIMFPSDRGIPMVNFYGKKLIFLNEERIFAIVKKPEEKKTNERSRKRKK